MVEYTKAEVSKRNGKDGERTWIVIKNCVYDVTDYMEEHPGTPELILECAGKDATKNFGDVGHSSTAKDILGTLKIGELKSDEGMDNKDNGENKDVAEKRRSYFSVLMGGIFNRKNKV